MLGAWLERLYAAGYSPSTIEGIIENVDRSRLFARGSREGPGLLGLSGMTQTLIGVLGDRRFEDLKIPFACTAVDIKTAQEVILSQGRVVDSLLATIAVPGVFPPKMVGEISLMDGGVMDPVPVALARWLTPSLPVVAVVLSPVPEGWKHMPSLAKSILPATTPIPLPILEQFSRMRLAQAFDVFMRSFDITSLMLSELRLGIDKPDAIIRPEVYPYGMLDAVDPHVMIALGEKAAALEIEKIKHSLAWHRRLSRRFRRAAPPGRLLLDNKKPEPAA